MTSAMVLVAAAVLSLSLILVPPPVEGKKVSGTAQLSSENCEAFLSKFSFSAQLTGKANGRFSTKGERYLDGHPHSLTVALYSDTEWPRYLEAVERGSLCEDRVKLASVRRPVKMDISADGGDAFLFEMTARLQKQDRSHYFYALLADCSLETYPAKPPPLAYELHFLNGNSELPADEDGMIAVHIVASLGLVTASVFACLKLNQQLGKFGQVHLSSLSVTLALLLQTLACVMELVHLIVFSADGRGMRWRWVERRGATELSCYCFGDDGARLSRSMKGNSGGGGAGGFG